MPGMHLLDLSAGILMTETCSQHQYRDKFKIWKFRKNCARLRPAVAVPIAEHGANSVLGMGISTTPHTEVTVEAFVDMLVCI